MSEVGLSQLLEAGVHFGHQTRRWNPKMKPFIFTERNGIHIIDLRKTLDRLQAAQQAVREVVLRGERVLFVCTKRQLRSIIEQEAQRLGLEAAQTREAVEVNAAWTAADEGRLPTRFAPGKQKEAEMDGQGSSWWRDLLEPLPFY